MVNFVKRIFDAVKAWLEELLGIKTKVAKEDLLKTWDEFAVSGRGRRLGQRLLKKDLKVIEEFLSKLGYQLELFPAKGAYEIEGFLNAAGKPNIFPAKAQAMFTYTTRKAKLCLREGCTMFEFFHELMHARHARSLGLVKYYKLGGAAHLAS